MSGYKFLPSTATCIASFLSPIKNPQTERGIPKFCNMGSEAEIPRKPRFLCLHGFRTSGEILKTQVHKWPESALQMLDLVYLDAPFPSQGKSDVEGIFDPPYYEWFQFNKVQILMHQLYKVQWKKFDFRIIFISKKINLYCFSMVWFWYSVCFGIYLFLIWRDVWCVFFQEFSEYTNFDECLAYIEDFMIKNGPFDGLLGFSQVGEKLYSLFVSTYIKILFGCREKAENSDDSSCLHFTHG